MHISDFTLRSTCDLPIIIIIITFVVSALRGCETVPLQSREIDHEDDEPAEEEEADVADAAAAALFDHHPSLLLRRFPPGGLHLDNI